MARETIMFRAQSRPVAAVRRQADSMQLLVCPAMVRPLVGQPIDCSSHGGRPGNK
jgi:hypothetical protein